MANHNASPPLPDPPHNDPILNTLKQLLAPMDAKMTFLVEEVCNIRSTANDAHEKATEATNIATNAKAAANEAIKASSEANLKINNLERRLKSLEENYTEFSY